MKGTKMHPLPPDLQLLIDRGLMSREDAEAAFAFAGALADAVVDGRLSHAQARALRGLLGMAEVTKTLRGRVAHA